jgi:hypothetical protein
MGYFTPKFTICQEVGRAGRVVKIAGRWEEVGR